MFIIIMYAPNCLNDTLLHDESYSLLGLLICADPPFDLFHDALSP